MRYIISIGSNVNPSQHVPWAIENMQQMFNEVVVSRFYRTQAFAMSSKHCFWNGVVMLSSDLACDALKNLLSCWEVESGRDRNHPQCSTRDRTLDLDILWQDGCGWLDDVEGLKKLPYMWQPVCSLLGLRVAKLKQGTVWFVVNHELLGGRRKKLR
jgi:2-amino-4-hydroxy-6-hydroxymethyldihydropteridine diphosphokinase